MNLLDEIISHKRREIENRKNFSPIRSLEKSIYFSTPINSLRECLLRENESGIIAEIKRKSPSKGIIHNDISVERISVGYRQAGASALSILTDTKFFGGTNEDLVTARKLNSCPILRKDFILDEYQIIESKALGADVVLLIAAVLQSDRLRKLCDLAHSFGLEVLLEVHDEEEINATNGIPVDLIGVNNRNLKTFEVTLETSKRLSAYLPDSIPRVSESGIESPEAILELRNFGFSGFLIGQAFMQSSSPEKAAMDFINELRRLRIENKMTGERKSIKLKVCGMRDPANILDVAGLRPDYMGFIFYRGSKRFVGEKFKIPPGVGTTIKKVGVFVNQTTAEIVVLAATYGLDFVQLHGNESTAQCEELQRAGLKLIKALSIHSDFDFDLTLPYKNLVDYFLFDTAGVNFGGNGVAFDWTILEKYDQDVPFFLSGGISADHLKGIDILKGMNLHALDVNSGVEREIGIKDVELIKELKIRSL